MSRPTSRPTAYADAPTNTKPIIFRYFRYPTSGTGVQQPTEEIAAGQNRALTASELTDVARIDFDYRVLTTQNKTDGLDDAREQHLRPHRQSRTTRPPEDPHAQPRTEPPRRSGPSRASPWSSRSWPCSSCPCSSPRPTSPSTGDMPAVRDRAGPQVLAGRGRGRRRLLPEPAAPGPGLLDQVRHRRPAGLHRQDQEPGQPALERRRPGPAHLAHHPGRARTSTRSS